MCACEIDHKIILEYLKLIISFPFVVIFVFITLTIIYKEDIRNLLKRIRNIKTSGTELSFEDGVSTTLDLVVQHVEEKIEKLEELPDSESKQARISELDTIINATIEDISSYITINITDEDKLAFFSYEMLNIRIKYFFEKSIRDWINENEVYKHGHLLINKRKGRTRDELYRECIREHPELVEMYGDKAFKKSMGAIISEFAPEKDGLDPLTVKR